MNSELRERMLESLRMLKQNNEVKAIKAEFEAEGSRETELVILCDAIRRVDFPLTIKIGGCEAARDMGQAKLFDAESIMAPMIESPYAMQKFKATAEKIFGEDIKRVTWIINAETKTCYENLDEILEAGEGFLDAVCIGRSDLSGSMGLSHEINGRAVFDVVKDMAIKAHAHGMHATFGGKIMPDAIGFVQEMAPYVDAYETRKVTFASTDDTDRIIQSIDDALHFEILYLKSKHEYYRNIAEEDKGRLARFDEHK